MQKRWQQPMGKVKRYCNQIYHEPFQATEQQGGVANHDPLLVAGRAGKGRIPQVNSS